MPKFRKKPVVIEAWQVQSDMGGCPDWFIDELGKSVRGTYKLRLPEGMEDRAIWFRECSKGDGRLVGENWIDHGCPTCALDAAREENNVLRDMLLRPNPDDEKDSVRLHREKMEWRDRATTAEADNEGLRRELSNASKHRDEAVDRAESLANHPAQGSGGDEP